VDQPLLVQPAEGGCDTDSEAQEAGQLHRPWKESISPPVSSSTSVFCPGWSERARGLTAQDESSSSLNVYSCSIFFMLSNAGCIDGNVGGLRTLRQTRVFPAAKEDGLLDHCMVDVVHTIRVTTNNFLPEARSTKRRRAKRSTRLKVLWSSYSLPDTLHFHVVPTTGGGFRWLNIETPSDPPEVYRIGMFIVELGIQAAVT
jgi:hypothetical protein